MFDEMEMSIKKIALKNAASIGHDKVLQVSSGSYLTQTTKAVVKKDFKKYEMKLFDRKTTIEQLGLVF